MEKFELTHLIERLIDDLDGTPKLAKELNPTELVLDEEGVRPFSDYYGTLVDFEAFLQNSKTFRSFFGEDFDHLVASIKRNLVANLKVENYPTLTGEGLNDRIRKLLEQDYERSNIKESKGKKRRDIPLKPIALVAAGILSLSTLVTGILYSKPSWREYLGLPVSVIEQVELFYGRGELEQAAKILNSATSEGLSGKVKAYWAAKLELGGLRENAKRKLTTRDYDSTYLEFGKMLSPRMLGAIDGAAPEISEEEIIATYLEAGFFKKGNDYVRVNDYSTPELAAKSYLCWLLDSQNPEQSQRLLDDREKKLLLTVKDNNVIYIGINQDNNIVYFLSGETIVGIPLRVGEKGYEPTIEITFGE